MMAEAEVNTARKNEKNLSNVVSSVAKVLELHPALLWVLAAVVLAVVLHAKPGFKHHQALNAKVINSNQKPSSV